MKNGLEGEQCWPQYIKDLASGLLEGKCSWGVFNDALIENGESEAVVADHFMRRCTPRVCILVFAVVKGRSLSSALVAKAEFSSWVEEMRGK